MKHLLTITLLALTISASAQTRKSLKNDTAKYTRFIKVPEQAYNSLLIFTQAYRDVVIYNQIMDDKTSRQEQVGVNQFLKELSKVVALDSVRVK